MSGKSKKGKPFAQSVGEGGNAVKRSWGRTNGLGFDFQFRSPSFFDFTNVADRKYTSLAALSKRNLLKNRRKRYSLEVSACAMSDDGCFSSTMTVCSGERVRCSHAETERRHNERARYTRTINKMSSYVERES